MTSAEVLQFPIPVCECGARIYQARTGPKRTCCAECSHKRHKAQDETRKAADPAKHLDRQRGNTRRWRENHPDARTSSVPRHDTRSRLKALLQSAKGRARRAGLPFDISIEDVEIPQYCPVLGLRLEVATGRGKQAPNSYSFDRIDSSKGYVRGNVWLISWRANDLKANGTVAEFERLIAAMRAVGAP